MSLKMRKAWIDPLGWLRFLYWARHHKPDILHAHLPHATWFARLVRLFYPVRVVIDTIHTSNTGSVARQRAYRQSSSLSNWTTCVSNPVAEAVIEAGMVPLKKVSLLPNGVVVPPESNIATERAQHPRLNFRWIAVGRLTPVKDYPTLLRAFAQLPATTHLKIAGSGPEEGRLRSLAHQLSIADRVHFTGFKSDVQPCLANADAFVLSSLWEGLPVSALEAAASGLPVVATDGAGTREAMIPDKTSLIVPVGNAAALAGAMSSIMAMTPSQRNQMGALGRRFVNDYYSLAKVVSEWEKLYNKLLVELLYARRRA
jgi:glycosyltransferase involved in cell wall biosynthesis